MADPVKVAAGRVHSAALTRGGDLYTWGSSKNGRLGFDCLSSSETVGATAVPQKVELPEELEDQPRESTISIDLPNIIA